MALADTITEGCAQAGAVVEPGGLNEERPLEFVADVELDDGAGHEAEARLWLQQLAEGESVLCIEMLVRRIRRAMVDMDCLRCFCALGIEWYEIGTCEATEFLDDGRVWVDITVRHSLATTGLTSSSVAATLNAMLELWRRASNEVTKLVWSRINSNPRVRNSPADMERQAALADLDRLVGLEPVKAVVKRLVAQHNVATLRRNEGMRSAEVSPHLVFTGNPGTGKTTVAQLIGRLYRSLGLLTKGHVVTADRSRLVAGYVGQTALKTAKVCQSALGGVLFIDEAYSLAGHGLDYGREAIETLLTFMEEHRNDVAVVVAGYPADMQRFLDSNPGLRSRFDITVDFPDYEDNELLQIFANLVAEHDYILDVTARRKLRFELGNLERGTGFGNARAMRTLFGQVVANHAALLDGIDDPSEDQLRRITGRAIPWTGRSTRVPASSPATARRCRRELSFGYL